MLSPPELDLPRREQPDMLGTEQQYFCRAGQCNACQELPPLTCSLHKTRVAQHVLPQSRRLHQDTKPPGGAAAHTRAPQGRNTNKSTQPHPMAFGLMSNTCEDRPRNGKGRRAAHAAVRDASGQPTPSGLVGGAGARMRSWLASRAAQQGAMPQPGWLAVPSCSLGRLGGRVGLRARLQAPIPGRCIHSLSPPVWQ